MQAAIDALKEHGKYLFEELASNRKRLADSDKSRNYLLGEIARKEIEHAEVNAAIARLEAK